MDMNHIKIGDTVYALIAKNALADNNTDVGEVFAMSGVVIGIHVDFGVTIRNDDFTFNVPADFIFNDCAAADAAALAYNNEHCENRENSDEQEFTVCVRVTGRALVTVRAKDAESARCKANGKVCDMDFGELEDIDWDGVYAEDENCNRTDY